MTWHFLKVAIFFVLYLFTLIRFFFVGYLFFLWIMRHLQAYNYINGERMGNWTHYVGYGSQCLKYFQHVKFKKLFNKAYKMSDSSFFLTPIVVVFIYYNIDTWSYTNLSTFFCQKKIGLLKNSRVMWLYLKKKKNLRFIKVQNINVKNEQSNCPCREAKSKFFKYLPHFTWVTDNSNPIKWIFAIIILSLLTN